MFHGVFQTPHRITMSLSHNPKNTKKYFGDFPVDMPCKNDFKIALTSFITLIVKPTLHCIMSISLSNFRTAFTEASQLDLSDCADNVDSGLQAIIDLVQQELSKPGESPMAMSNKAKGPKSAYTFFQQSPECKKAIASVIQASIDGSLEGTKKYLKRDTSTITSMLWKNQFPQILTVDKETWKQAYENFKGNHSDLDFTRKSPKSSGKRSGSTYNKYQACVAKLAKRPEAVFSYNQLMEANQWKKLSKKQKDSFAEDKFCQDCIDRASVNHAGVITFPSEKVKPTLHLVKT
jgi:hypothetical protein